MVDKKEENTEVSGPDAFARSRGFQTWAEWNQSQIKVSKISDSPSTSLKGTPIGGNSKSFLADGGGEVLEKTTFSLDDLRTSVLQRQITDPDVSLVDLTRLFIGTTGAVSDEFATHQYSRSLWPENYEDDLARGGSGWQSSGMIDMVLPNVGLPYIEKMAKDGDPDAIAKVTALRKAYLKLNILIMAGQNPLEFDWKNFDPMNPEPLSPTE